MAADPAAQAGGGRGMSATPELRALTGARGIAAWAVVLFHVRLLLENGGGLHGQLSHGYLAVDFFFMLSGFVIWLTWFERLRAGGIEAVPRFLQRRIARIWPLHIAMLASAVAFALVLIATGRNQAGQFPFGELPLHVLLLQNWGFTDRLVWNVPAWSISCELAAYLLFPLLAFAADWRRVPSWALLAGIVTGAALLHTIFALEGATSLGQLVTKWGVLRCISEFASGTMVCALWLRWRERPWPPAIGAGLVAGVLLAGDVGGLVPETLAMPLLFAALVLLLALTAGIRGNPLEWGPVHYLGEISYATYLGHWLLWIAFKILFVRDGEGVEWGLFAVFALALLALSAALYHWVERPAQRRINRLELPSRPRKGTAQAPTISDIARGAPLP